MSAKEEGSDMQAISDTEPEPVDISLKLIVRRHFPREASTWSGEKIAEELHKVTHVRLDREHIGSLDNLLLFSTNVTNVYLQHNKIENLDGLAFLMNLRFLMAANNCIRNISGIVDLQFLRFVDLSNNKISNICKGKGRGQWTLDSVPLYKPISSQKRSAELPPAIVILNLTNNPCVKDTVNYRSELLARLLRLKQLDNIMVNSETYNVDDDNDDNDDDDDDDNDVDLAVNDSNAFNACHQILSVEECSVRNVADTILERSQTHLEAQFAEHKRRLAQLDELRLETPRTLATSSRPLTASNASR